MKDFQDHFSTAAGAYAEFRPTYPARLFEELAARARRTRWGWDCATESGQAALGLADVVRAVVATDASAAQLEGIPAALGPAAGRVHRLVARAEASGLATASIDVVTVAQALHWFDRDAFFAEARRVLAPGGVVAAWCYGVVTIDPGIDACVGPFYRDVVGPYWPPERALVDGLYRAIAFPFAEFALPALELEARWTLERFAGYVGTWSATLRFRRARGVDPVPELIDAIRPLWGHAPRRVRWPLAVRAGTPT